MTAPIAIHPHSRDRMEDRGAGESAVGAVGVSDHLKRFPRLHVRLRWEDDHGHLVQLPGPLCLGGGRFYGIGLFAVQPEAPA